MIIYTLLGSTYSTFATKWDFDKMGFRLPNGKQEKYFENGISIKWDSLTTFSAWRIKWDYDILFFKLWKFAWKLFLVCRGLIVVRNIQQSFCWVELAAKWDSHVSEKRLQEKYRENGISNKGIFP